MLLFSGQKHVVLHPILRYTKKYIVSPSPEPADGHRHKAGQGDEAGQRHQGPGQQEETDGGGQQGPGGDYGTGEGGMKEEHI